jgi:hypothetical protein
MKKEVVRNFCLEPLPFSYARVAIDHIPTAAVDTLVVPVALGAQSAYHAHQ